MSVQDLSPGLRPARFAQRGASGSTRPESQPPRGLVKPDGPCNNAANVESPLAVITYEYPLNEKVRTLLRLEDMYDRVLLFTGRDAPRDHEVAFSRLFEILEAGSRSDVKSDLLQELDRQRVLLESLRGNPDVSGDRLDAALEEVIGAAAALQATQGKFGQHLRDNDWVMAIRSRFNIPGGACEFDLPGFHHWLHHPSYVRQGQLQAWLEPLLPIHRALGTILRLLRDSSDDHEQTARRGTFQQMPMLRPAQMLRIQLEDGLGCVPELSANKYALNIRFISNAAGLRPTLYEHDVPFRIAYCNL
jgi:cell division protein ZapD